MLAQAAALSLGNSHDRKLCTHNLHTRNLHIRYATKCSPTLQQNAPTAKLFFTFSSPALPLLSHLPTHNCDHYDLVVIATCLDDLTQPRCNHDVCSDAKMMTNAMMTTVMMTSDDDECDDDECDDGKCDRVECIEGQQSWWHLRHVEWRTYSQRKETSRMLRPAT